MRKLKSILRTICSPDLRYIWAALAFTLICSSYQPKPIAYAAEPEPEVIVVNVLPEAEPVTVVEPYWSRVDVPLTDDLREQLFEACSEFSVPYELALAVINRETRFQNISGDSGNSFGYMQIQPKWWSGLMNEIGATDLMTPRDNFRTGCAILNQLSPRLLVDASAEEVKDCLSLYNSGSRGNREYADPVFSQYLEYLEETV